MNPPNAEKFWPRAYTVVFENVDGQKAALAVRPDFVLGLLPRELHAQAKLLADVQAGLGKSPMGPVKIHDVFYENSFHDRGLYYLDAQGQQHLSSRTHAAVGVNAYDHHDSDSTPFDPPSGSTYQELTVWKRRRQEFFENVRKHLVSEIPKLLIGWQVKRVSIDIPPRFSHPIGSLSVRRAHGQPGSHHSITARGGWKTIRVPLLRFTHAIPQGHSQIHYLDEEHTELMPVQAELLFQPPLTLPRAMVHVFNTPFYRAKPLHGKA